MVGGGSTFSGVAIRQGDTFAASWALPSDRGIIRGLSAFAIGGRLIASDAHGAWTRIDQSARLVAEDLGLDLTPQALPVLARGRPAALVA